MPSEKRVASSRRRVRHGRALRSAVTGRFLPPLRGRRDEFESIVSQSLGFARSLWPEEMRNVTVHIASAPAEAVHGDHIDRWVTDPERMSVTLFRIPISRFDRRAGDDDVQFHMIVEGYVYRAIAELLGKDPWDIAKHRYGR